jgi:hypothetical protein
MITSIGLGYWNRVSKELVGPNVSQVMKEENSIHPFFLLICQLVSKRDKQKYSGTDNFLILLDPIIWSFDTMMEIMIDTVKTFQAQKRRQNDVSSCHFIWIRFWAI